jgi:N-acetylglucosaminyldiphosphoundecaprenol N-acetyl-beta-D-mannosaminyltransferase
MKPTRISILGVPVDCVTMQSAIDFVDETIARGDHGTVVAVNPEKVMKARKDPALLSLLEASTLLIPDGIGIVWAARFLGLARTERVPGSDLMPALCQNAAVRGHRLFLYGASSESNRGAIDALRARYPRIRIVGGRDGYVTPDQMPSLLAEINDSGANIVFVALGSPRQEQWMRRYAGQLSANICQGVGGTFDVLAGRVRRAPKAWRDLNLEWAYRLLAQPRRILRQTALPAFVWQVLRAAAVGSPANERDRL